MLIEAEVVTFNNDESASIIISLFASSDARFSIISAIMYRFLSLISLARPRVPSPIFGNLPSSASMRAPRLQGSPCWVTKIARLSLLVMKLSGISRTLKRWWGILGASSRGASLSLLLSSISVFVSYIVSSYVIGNVGFGALHGSWRGMFFVGRAGVGSELG